GATGRYGATTGRAARCDHRSAACAWRRPGSAATARRRIRASQKRDERREIWLRQVVVRRHARPAARDDFAQRLRSDSQRDIDERRIVAITSQLRTMTAFALLLIERPSACDGFGRRRTASARDRCLVAQLVNRRNVDAQ